MTNQDEEHLRLLSMFHYICAGVAALFACIPIIHLSIGALILARPNTFGHGSNAPPVFIGLFLIAIAALLIIFGWAFAVLLAWSGRCLSRRTHYTFCLVMAGVACFFMPFGTVLGVFTILVLTRPSVKILFSQNSPPIATRP